MSSLPYVTSPGNIPKALNGIKNAAVPDKISQDFVKTILQIPGGSGDQMTAFLKKLGFANSDGSPNDLYRSFRNPSSTGRTLAGLIKNAYGPLFVRNTYAHKLTDEELIGLIVEETGNAHDSNPVKLIFSSLKQLKSLADFSEEEELEETSNSPSYEKRVPVHHEQVSQEKMARSFGMNLSYTINLNLPATSDPAVFDAIFKSLKQNLLSEDDA